MDYAEKAMELHRQLRGKLEMHTRTETGTREALSIAYTPRCGGSLSGNQGGAGAKL